MLKLLRRKKKPERPPEDWRKMMERSERIMAANPGLFPQKGFISQFNEFCEWQRRDNEKRKAVKDSL